jgi:hypothetical protein
MPPNPAGNAASDPEAKKKAARETIDILHEISTLLVRPKNPLWIYSHVQSPSLSEPRHGFRFSFRSLLGFPQFG